MRCVSVVCRYILIVCVLCSHSLCAVVYGYILMICVIYCGRCGCVLMVPVVCAWMWYVWCVLMVCPVYCGLCGCVPLVYVGVFS